MNEKKRRIYARMCGKVAYDMYEHARVELDANQRKPNKRLESTHITNNLGQLVKK